MEHTYVGTSTRLMECVLFNCGASVPIVLIAGISRREIFSYVSVYFKDNEIICCFLSR